MSGIKGFWTGFQRGLYKNSKMALDDRCMSANMTTDLFFIANFFGGYGSFSDVVPFVTKVAGLINDNFNFCGYTEAVSMINKFCTTNDCSSSILLQNVTNRLF